MRRVLTLICLINIVACAISLSARAVLRRSLEIPPETEGGRSVEVKVLSLSHEEEAQQAHILQITTHGNSSANASVIKDSATTNITATSAENLTSQNNVVIPTRKQTVDSDALLRGFYVFIGLSVATLLYVMYRSYRLRLGGNRPTTVRKYGILTQRTDMEMLPLPLDDDDEDDTVFDVGSHTNR